MNPKKTADIKNRKSTQSAKIKSTDSQTNKSQSTKVTTQQKTQWHPGVYAAIVLELTANRHQLQFEAEHPLSKKPLLMDLLIIKKEPNIAIENTIGAIFQKYNIVEYKSPDDSLSIDAFYKVIAYACLYKSSAPKENAYDASDITITFIRQRYPRTLMAYLKKNGYSITKYSAGIYYITSDTMFHMQVIVTRELASTDHIWLRSLQNNLTRDDYHYLLNCIEMLSPKEKEEYGKAVLHVASNANKPNIMKWKEESTMTCPALEEIMAPEILAHKRQAWNDGKLDGKREGTLSSLRNLIKNTNMPLEDAMTALGIPEAEKDYYRENI